jgi:hypothetical protein
LTINDERKEVIKQLGISAQDENQCDFFCYKSYLSLPLDYGREGNGNNPLFEGTRYREDLKVKQEKLDESADFGTESSKLRKQLNSRKE